MNPSCGVEDDTKDGLNPRVSDQTGENLTGVTSGTGRLRSESDSKMPLHVVSGRLDRQISDMITSLQSVVRLHPCWLR